MCDTSLLLNRDSYMDVSIFYSNLIMTFDYYVMTIREYSRPQPTVGYVIGPIS